MAKNFRVRVAFFRGISNSLWLRLRRSRQFVAIFISHNLAGKDVDQPRARTGLVSCSLSASAWTTAPLEITTTPDCVTVNRLVSFSRS